MIDSDTGSGHRGVLAAAIAVVAVLLLVGLAFATGLIGGGSGSGRNNTPSAAGQGGTATSRTSSSAGASSGKSGSLRSSTVPSSSAPSSTVPSSSAPSSTVPSSSAPSSTVPSSSAPSSTVPSSSAPSSSVKPSTVPSSSAPSNAGVGGTPSGAQLAAAISGYYALLPDNTDGGWSRLTSRYQTDHAGGRANYNSFWDAVERVSVSNVVGLPPSAAEADITYVAKDGHVTRERTSFGLVSEGGIFKIDTSTVLSSQSG